MPIHYDKSDHIVLITLDRYEKRNALDVEHGMALLDAWKTFRDDDDAWVAIVTGVKTAFCAGGDLGTLGSTSAVSRKTNEDFRNPFADENNARWTLKNLDVFKPIISAVNGHCIAGGFEMFGATDIRVANTQAFFQIAEPRRGLIAFGGTTSRLPRQLPWVHAMELLLTADRIDAHRALEIGLINEVVQPDELLDTAYRWARRITQNAPLAVQAAKKSAVLAFRSTLQEGLVVEDRLGEGLFATEDASEGIAAFLEKRAPVWKAR
jgi:enoyl-CoA hydratase